MSTTYQGSCHCGGIRFQATGELEQVMECNCSICRRKGAKLWFVPRTQFKLLSERNKLATYTFNTQRIQHHFCPTCGIAPFGEGTDPKGNEMAAINVRCLEGIDIDALPVQRFDGASL
ncbi:MAG TPA: GFA family protein [Geothermobacteraceae bacterium]|nr:GFA family protein [Geothermobacteraceae bacterium]